MADSSTTACLPEKEQRPVAGILFLLLGTTIFPLQDVIIKPLSGDYALHQIVFLRGLFTPMVGALPKAFYHMVTSARPVHSLS